MPIAESAADRLALLGDDFGVEVTFTAPGPVVSQARAIFDREGVETDVGVMVEVVTTEPQIVCRTADVPAGILDGTTVLVPGEPFLYVATEHLQDGTGMSVIRLRRAAGS